FGLLHGSRRHVDALDPAGPAELGHPPLQPAAATPEGQQTLDGAGVITFHRPPPRLAELVAGDALRGVVQQPRVVQPVRPALGRSILRGPAPPLADPLRAGVVHGGAEYWAPWDARPPGPGGEAGPAAYAASVPIDHQLGCSPLIRAQGVDPV